MKRRTEEWPISRLVKERSRVTFPEYQREKSLWSEEKKSLLIDSILKDIDIPKLYFNLVPGGDLEVVDGQQRLWTIWEFVDGQFPYRDDKKKRFFEQLTDKEQASVSSYVLQVTIFENADDEYLRQLFVRLQLGLLLEAGEKLNAASGAMKTFVFKDMATRSFVLAIGIPSRRFAKETLCAQIAINSFSLKKNKAFARTRYEDLVAFFDAYAAPTGADLALFEEQTSSILNCLDQMHLAYGRRALSLRNRSFILSAYLFIEQAKLDGSAREVFVEFSILLLKRLKEESRKGMDRENRELYTFQSLLSSAPGEEYQIRRRHDKIAEYFRYYTRTAMILGDDTAQKGLAL